MLPGVAFACCGHGVQSEAYVHFVDSPIRLDDFTVTRLRLDDAGTKEKI